MKEAARAVLGTWALWCLPSLKSLWFILKLSKLPPTTYLEINIYLRGHRLWRTPYLCFSRHLCHGFRLMCKQHNSYSKSKNTATQVHETAGEIGYDDISIAWKLSRVKFRLGSYVSFDTRLYPVLGNRRSVLKSDLETCATRYLKSVVEQ